MVDVARQLGGEIRDPIACAVYRERRHWRRNTRARTPLRNEDPDVAVALFAGIANGVNLFRIEPGIGGEGRNLSAGAGVHVKLPAVVGALDLLPVNGSVGERHTAMRTTVAHGEGAALLIASDDHGNTEQQRLSQLLPSAYLVAPQRRIPEVGEQ